MRGVNAAPPHLPRILAEVRRDLLCQHHRPYRLRAGDALIEIPGQHGVHLPHPAIHPEHTPLKKANRCGSKRQKQQEPEREPRLNPKHHKHREENVGKIPYKIHQPP